MLQTSLGRQKFRGLFSHDGNGNVERLYGGVKIPLEITEDMVDKYYRYDSGAKEFKEIVGMKRFNNSTDAVSLVPGYDIPKTNRPDANVVPDYSMPMPKFNIS